MRSRKQPKHDIPFRKILPNMITSGSILCGMLSLILVMHGHVLPGAWLVACAVLFDFMDGKVARMLGGSSAFGIELDSLADVVSFGVAPSVLTYICYLDLYGGIGGALAAAFYALCGALRLARFNVTHVVGPFQGLPIPAAGIFLASLVIADVPLQPWMGIFLLVGLGGLMISNVPYGNLKCLKAGNIHNGRACLVLGLMALFVLVLKERALLAMVSIYVASGLVRFDWGEWLALGSAEEEDPVEDDV